MSFYLQRFDYRSSQYHRPNQQWVCGREAIGNPCRLGPGNGGECRTIAECEPLKKGDRWTCTRPDTAGGKCSDGPLPDGSCCNKVPRCAPRPSVRNQRGRLVRWAIAAVFGILLVAGGGAFGSSFFNPGPVSSGHSEIENCGSCHSAFAGGPVAWVGHMFDGSTESKDVANCVSCHAQKDGLPHNQSSEQLAALTAEAETRQHVEGTKSIPVAVASAFDVGVRNSEHGQVACRSCHKEHQGLTADISQLNDSQCQTCHTTLLPEFDGSHPFGNFPYTRRTRLQFDHVGHIDKYFLDPSNVDKAPETCRSCHEPDNQGKLMVIGGFDENCASCHGEFIADKPVQLIRLPGIDMYTMQDLEADMGEWPEYADAEELTPYMQVLLSGDESFAEAWAFIQDEGMDLLDLEDASEEELQAAQTVAWSIKGLIYDLLTEGPSFVQERLETAVDNELSASEIRELVASIPMETLYAAQTRWFPNLYKEVEAHRDGEAVPVPEELPEDFEPAGDIVDSKDWVESGGWYIEYFSINYKLSGHGDKFARAWIILTANAAETSDLMSGVAEELIDVKAPGGCLACHSIDRDVAEGDSVINWKASTSDPHASTFTEFVHSKHFALIGDKGCATCHTIDSEADYKSSFAGMDPTDYVSNFAPLEAEVCASCHNPSKVVTTCTDCHNYHVGSFPPAAVETEMVVNQEMVLK